MGWRERVTRFLGGVPASEVSQIVGSARAEPIDFMSDKSGDGIFGGEDE